MAWLFSTRRACVASCRCVLKAVKWLHLRGWGHGDIRWENIIKETESSYRLIDLECALRLDTKCTDMKAFPLAWGENGAALEKGQFTAQSDLFMVGGLMQQAFVHGELGEALMTALLSKTINVDAALSHQWFAVE